jgi:hypothetical protein
MTTLPIIGNERGSAERLRGLGHENAAVSIDPHFYDLGVCMSGMPLAAPSDVTLPTLRACAAITSRLI